MPEVPATLVNAVRAALTDDLLRPAFRRRHRRAATAGHCYAASEALYHLLGGKPAGWTPMRLRHEGDPHWYLRHADGTILDATADQFATPVPYETGIGCGFLTGFPSARASEIIARTGTPVATDV
jgi:hypothetical protein